MRIKIIVCGLAFLMMVGVQSPASGFLHGQDLAALIRDGDLAALKQEIAANPELIHQKAAHGRSLLHIAVISGKNDIMEYLISNGADINTEDQAGQSPLAWAVLRNRADIVELLIRSGADFKSPFRGISLLHQAVANSNIGIADILIEKGISVNTADRLGGTPLHFAAELGLSEATEFLISKGADLNLRDKFGATPLHIAEEAMKSDILELLSKKGAQKLPRNFPRYQGAYLGSKLPGETLELFPPTSVMKIVGAHSGVAISPDGREIFWVRGDFSGAIWYMKEISGAWTRPRIAPFSGECDNSYPCFSPDGNSLYFTSDRPADETAEIQTGIGDIWYVERTGEGWTDPINAGQGVNTQGDEFIASVDKDRNLYFTRIITGNNGRTTDIFKSEFIDNQYRTALPVSGGLNSDRLDVGPFVSPDGRYIILSSEKFGEMTTCLSFKNQDGSWSESVSIQALFTPFTNSYPQGFTSDGKSILFAGRKDGVWDVYWMNTDKIESLISDHLKIPHQN